MCDRIKIKPLAIIVKFKINLDIFPRQKRLKIIKRKMKLQLKQPEKITTRRERDEGPERNAIYTSPREDGKPQLLDLSRKFDSTRNEKNLKLGT
jgi:hypothetical protein